VSPLKFFLATLIASPKLFLHVWIGQQMAELTERGDKMDARTKAVSYVGIAIGSVVGGVTGWWIWRQTVRRARELQEMEAGALEEGEVVDPREFEDDDVLELGGDMDAAMELLNERERDVERARYDDSLEGSFHDEGSEDDVLGEDKAMRENGHVGER
jgi:hypothetical protein